ncbi:hypothetical protein GDO86_009529 [Hymenochirus boettgeri]|uniref:ELYS-like domain-containing protein n=1 Tax=Hymenochirus boettgeri TaxID=247094 RepID=A0A8T2JJA0_9PIPI|nr:hypothetical protein GDO86_009529 [Hymenochirus boettgeri]
MQLSRPYYNYQAMHHYYEDQRKKLEHLARGKWNTSSLMIDGLINQFGDRIEQLWSRDENGTGKYPPANLHALLDLYLLENVDEMSKHEITIYFLLDLLYSSPDKPDCAIESFPTAFSVPYGRIKLIQGFWLMDHNDYQNSVDCILHPASSQVISWQHLQIVETLMCQGDQRQALRYIQAMKPAAATSEEVKLHITVLLANRYILEAWNLQRLHSSQLNVQELLEHMYETCREMGLMEDLLKLNFTDSEQESLQKFLQTTGAKNQELLLVHHLQRANYIPALQLNQSLKTIHMNDCDRRLRERAVARNAILDQYGKILPRVQRTLASERAKPYSLSFVWREVSRPKPLSTIAKPAFPGSIITKANFISNVLSKIKEVSAANDNREEFSPYKSFVNEDALLANSIQDSEPPAAFFVTPVTKSRRVSRLLDSVVHPVLTEPSLLAYSLADDIYQTPNNKSLKKTSSPLHSSLRKIAHLRSFVKTSEFDLLLTPLVVRKAKALANITTSSGFAGITPQSILRSSLRTTPLVSPSVSPGRSLTPPLRHKETKISFMEEIKNKGSNGVKLLDVSPVLKSSPDAMWSEKKVTVFTDSTSVERFVGKDKSPGMLERSPDKMEVSKASNASVRSDQTTLEYHDAPTPENFENAEFLLTTDSHQQVIEQTSCLFEIEGGLSEKETILQQIDISNFESECLSAHLNCPNMLEQVTGKDVYLKKVVESFSKTSEVCLPCGTGEPECGSSAKDSESVITINDSEDIQSSLSENQDEGTGFRKNIIDAEQPANSGTASDGLSLQALEPKAQNVQLEENESEETNYKELYTCEAVKLGINVESIEQCYTCEITDDKDSNEQFEAENNFSLILESGDADDEILETESCKRDQLQLARPAISSRVNCSDLIENICNHKEEVIPLLTNEFSPVENDLESKVGKTLPYVPEPIKITNMENLIEVLKNTSKEVSHEFNNESSSESEPLGEIMITHATSKLPMDNTNTNSISKVEELETLERKMDNVNELRVSPNVYKPAGVKSATPRRSIRNSLKTTESSIANSRAKVLPVTPKKVAKKAKDLETVENCVSTIQKEEIYISTKRMTRKTNIATSEKPEQTGSEEATFKETLLVLTPTRGRKARALETDKESDQEEFSLPITPTRMTRSRMSLDPEKSTSHIEETVENDQVYVTPKRGRRAKRVVNELVRHFENNSSQPSHKVDISPSASPKRMSRRWTRSKSENQIYNAPEEEAEKNQEQTTDTPTKRCKMSPTDQMHMEETSDVNSDHTTEENVQISVTRHSTKKATISRSVKKAALSPVNEEKLLGNCSNIDDDNEENKTTRITRTRARNKNTLPEVSAINFEFSTPTSRTKKPPKGSSVPPEIIQLDPAQYVFSPPSTRTRRATRSGTSEAANEKDLHVQDSQEFLTVSKEPSSRPKGRPPIHKSTRSSRAQKKSSWSTPPVEVKLISPPESPAVSTAHTKTEPTESKGAEKNIRQTRRRIIMLKPVTRRKVR